MTMSTLAAKGSHIRTECTENRTRVDIVLPAYSNTRWLGMGGGASIGLVSTLFVCPFQMENKQQKNPGLDMTSAEMSMNSDALGRLKIFSPSFLDTTLSH